MRYPERTRALVLVDAALGLTAPPSDAPALVQPKWVREILVSLSITNPLATKWLLRSLIAKKERALPEYVEILQRPTRRAGSTRSLKKVRVVSHGPTAVVAKALVERVPSTAFSRSRASSRPVPVAA
jgi:pimeloyl-ACP methyl ester carboxylesterase